MLILVSWFNSSGLRKVKYYWLYYCEFLSVLQPCKYLLPAVRHQDMHKKCVVIDLDETLVHSSFKVQSWLFDKVIIVVVNVKKAINIHDPGAWAPLIFRPNWGPKGQKIFFGRLSPPPLLYLRVWMTTHPLISRSGSGTEILQTNLETFPWRISWENLMKDQSISLWWSFFYSHNLFAWGCFDVVGRKLMLVTFGT